MLFRVAGKLTNEKRFSARIEAPSAIAAIGQIRGAFQEANIPETDIAKVACQPVKGGKSLRISEPRSAENSDKPRTKKPK